MDTETKLELVALCNLPKNHRQTLDEMNLEIQGLTNIDYIDGEIARIEDNDGKIELEEHRATTKLATDGSSTAMTSNNPSGGNQDSRFK